VVEKATTRRMGRVGLWVVSRAQAREALEVPEVRRVRRGASAEPGKGGQQAKGAKGEQQAKGASPVPLV